MNKKSLLTSLLTIFLLGACSNTTSSKTSSDSSISSDNSSNTNTSSSDTSSSSTDDSKDDDSSTDSGDVVPPDPEENIIDLGKKSIEEVKELCFNKEYVADSDLNSFGNGYSKKYKVSIDGLALTCIDLLKTKKAYGLDFSSPQKTILGSGTDYIAVASSALYDKAKDYVGKATSSYTVTGYLSVYLGHPEIYAFEYEWKQNLNIKFDSVNASTEISSIENFYEIASENNYNCAGHGYGEMYSLKSLKVFDKKDEQFYLTDGERMVKAICYATTTLTIGNVYNIYGILSLLNYSPALKITSFEKVDAVVENKFVSTSISTSIAELKEQQASQDDTDKKYPEFIQGFQYIYTANVYISACVENSNYYMIASDSYSTSKTYTTGKGNTAANYNAALLRNDSLWNRSYDELNSDKISINPFRDYLDEEKTITIYFFRWQLDYYNKKTAWTIFLLSDFFPNEDSSLV